jgi:hypothetical protein
MNDRIRQLLKQISSLESELNAAIEEQEKRIRYQIHGKRVVFEQAIHEAHCKLRKGLIAWVLTIRSQNLLTAPIIYGMIVPLVLFDLSVSFYQLTCFPIYGITRVKRSRYIVMDHRHLGYLNIIEKVNCMYCSYAVGMLGYASEIAARTEQYFCPIKHARKTLGESARYAYFLEYGDAEEYYAKAEKLRSELAVEHETYAGK